MPRNKHVKRIEKHGSVWEEIPPFHKSVKLIKIKQQKGAGNMRVKTQKMGLSKKMLHMPKVVDSLGEVDTVLLALFCF